MSSVSIPARSEIKENPVKWRVWIFVSVMILAGGILRFLGLGFVSIDIQNFLLDWYDELATDGFGALREPFADYTPPYLYLLFFATKTLGFLPKLTAIKLLSICFDFLNAVLVHRILRIKYSQGSIPWIGAASFLLLPTALLNSSYWGQSDAIYTFFLLACLFFLMKDQPFLAMIFWGLSFSFKAQAVFLAPFILLLTLRKKIPWFYLGIVPLVYTFTMIPAALAGRPLLELLTTYTRQAATYHTLSFHAPNLYILIPDTLYTPVVIIGLIATALISLIWAMLYARKLKDLATQTILLCALVSAAFMPFFLPKMHDRYFYVAEVLSLLVAFYIPNLWPLALGYQFVSGLVYYAVIKVSILAIDPAVAGSMVVFAAFANTILLGYVFWNQWRLTTNDAYEAIAQAEVP